MHVLELFEPLTMTSENCFPTKTVQPNISSNSVFFFSKVIKCYITLFFKKNMVKLYSSFFFGQSILFFLVNLFFRLILIPKRVRFWASQRLIGPSSTGFTHDLPKK